MMRRAAATLALATAANLLGGCVYDPYSGGWYYGYPYAYRYPAPYYPYGYMGGPYGAPPAAQPGQYQGPAGGAGFPAQGDTLAQAFAVANVTHDGRLTRQQAADGMPLVAQNFDAIDFDQKGYITLPEVRAFIARQQETAGQPG
jgi:hypothetical protein